MVDDIVKDSIIFYRYKSSTFAGYKSVLVRLLYHENREGHDSEEEAECENHEEEKAE